MLMIFFLFFSFFPLILGFQPSNSSLIGDSLGTSLLEEPGNHLHDDFGN